MDTSVKNGGVVHFEMPYEDPRRVADFYRDAFGWEMQQMGEPWKGYIMAMTTESDPNGPKNMGVINGGFFKKSDKFPSVTTVVVQVASLEETMKKVTEAGGKIVGEVLDIAQVGRYVAVEDSERNRVGILQPAV